jgi:hypothetical protein
VGWSAGARVIFRALELLAEAGAVGRGIVDSAFLLGCPVSTDRARWHQARGVVADRLVNGYAPADWLLSLTHRTTSATVSAIAGLEPVPHPAVENVHIGAFIGKKGHLQYRKRAHRILEALGVSGSSTQQRELQEPKEQHESA